MPQYSSIAIVGVGLIGGSIGMSLRSRQLAWEVVGVGRSAKRLEQARSLGAIDRGTTTLAEGVGQAELVVVCTPVETIVQTIREAATAAPIGGVLTDAGSTKRIIVEDLDASVNAASPGPSFVGSHPLAGDHRTGCEFGRPDLFENRVTVVTPSTDSKPSAVAKVKAFWESLGSRVVEMAPADHDQALAITSHLPHLVASALAGLTPKPYLPLTAGGWQDTTRVAAGDPELWRQIFTANRIAVLEAIERFEGSLAALRSALRGADDQRLLELLQEAKQIRDALGS